VSRGGRNTAAVGGALLALAVTLVGCAAPSRPPVPTLTTLPSPATAPNDLTTEEMIDLQSECGGEVTSDVAGLLLSLPQARVDAARYLVSTDQCGDVAAVTEAGASPARDDAFVSPLSYIEPDCDQTVVSFWAHYDDDLLFGNPSIDRALAAGDCVRTVFFTYSDAGEGVSTYADERERGIRAAYDVMRGTTGAWTDRPVTLKSGATITVTRPDGDPRVSLMFVRLPDGGLSGASFIYTGEQTLSKLVSGELLSLRSLDEGRSFSRKTLEASVSEIAAAYPANQIYTHLPAGAAGSDGDHPDHQSVGVMVQSALTATPTDAEVFFAQGYPAAERPANNVGDELARKGGIFATYAAFDPVIGCRDAAGCLSRAHFGDWVQRQYLMRPEEIGMAG